MSKVGILEIPKREDGIVDLESQFILRLPDEPAKVLKEAIDSGDPLLKDRMSIKLENDMRYGEVRLDHWMFFAKVVDLPCIIESLKTIDRKSFYKTADICQMVICKEEDDRESSDEEEASKKKKDVNKVDKKFLFPHGVTPPMKNVRKRRFRKTLRKKFVEAPEIEKEVKRLFRGDNEALSVKWELVTEEPGEKSKSFNRFTSFKEEPLGHSTSHYDESNSIIKPDLAEHDIFGGAVSDSEEEEETNVNIMDMDEENSHFSVENYSQLSDSATLQHDSQSAHDASSHTGSEFITQFNKEMFIGQPYDAPSTSYAPKPSNVKQEMAYSSNDFQNQLSYDYGSLFKGETEDMSYDAEQLSSETIQARMDVLDQEISELENKRRQQELELVNIENHTLRQRFQQVLDSLNIELMEKDQEYQKLATMLTTPPDC